MNVQDRYLHVDAATGDTVVTFGCGDCARHHHVRIPAAELTEAERLMDAAGALMARAGLASRSGLSVSGERPSWDLGLGRVAFALAADRLPERCGCEAEKEAP